MSSASPDSDLAYPTVHSTSGLSGVLTNGGGRLGKSASSGKSAMEPLKQAETSHSGNGEDGGGAEEEEEGEEEEDGDAEPVFKYLKLGSHTPALLSTDLCTVLRVHFKFLLLGTATGHIHILDFTGSNVRSFYPHPNSAISAISVDDRGEFVATLGADGKAVVTSLLSDEKPVDLISTATPPTHPNHAIHLCIDPLYASSSQKKNKRVVSVSKGGAVVAHSKGWFSGTKDQVISQGEGDVSAIAWSPSGVFLSWAIAASGTVKVFNMETSQPVALFNMNQSLSKLPSAPQLSPSSSQASLPSAGTTVSSAGSRMTLIWTSEELMIAVGPLVRILRAPDFSSAANLVMGDAKILGIAPFANEVIVLSQNTVDGATELRLVDRSGEELSVDALSLVTSVPPSPGGPMNSQTSVPVSLAHHDLDDAYYIYSARDIVVARPRDMDDHIMWLLEKSQIEEAWRECKLQRKNIKVVSPAQIGDRLLSMLITERRIDDAVAYLPEVCNVTGASSWEKWISTFIKGGQVASLVKVIPPKLSQEIYESVLRWMIEHDPNLSLSLVKGPWEKWFRPDALMEACEQFQRYDILAHLFVLRGEFHRAFQIYVNQRSSGLFSFMEMHALWDPFLNNLLTILNVYNPAEVISLLTRFSDNIPVSRVVNLLSGDRSLEIHLHNYLHALFNIDPKLTAPFHGLQVTLYAKHDPLFLGKFLRTSSDYPLQLAHDVCAAQPELFRERVYVLGKMGNLSEALHILMDNGAVRDAIEFLQERAPQDEDLWNELVTHALRSGDAVGELLECNVSDPIRLIQRIPAGMEIPRLRDRLVKVISEYTLHMSLQEGCRDVLKADTLALTRKLLAVQRMASKIDGAHMQCATCHASSLRPPLAVFLCGHIYHTSCLRREQGTDTGKKSCPICKSNSKRSSTADD
eukprot:ANDGO_00771.mRNA.1 Vacuolar protein sorting-associated protein 41 homolog